MPNDKYSAMSPWPSGHMEEKLEIHIRRKELCPQQSSNYSFNLQATGVVIIVPFLALSVQKFLNSGGFLNYIY